MTSQQPEPGSTADASVGQLGERLSAQLSTLIRDEIALATTEIKRTSARAGLGIGIGGVGALLALYGLGALIAAAVLGLAHALVGWLATVVIGAALLLLAGIISALGITQVRHAAPPMPQQTVHRIQRDLQTVKHRMRR